MESFTDDSGNEVTEEQAYGSNMASQRHSNGHQVTVPTSTNHRAISPKTHNRKPASFNRAFKQAVFQKRGKEDGSSNLHVTFTSSRASSKTATQTVAKQLALREHQESRAFAKSTGLANIKPKSKSAMYKDIVTIDKKKMQEEIESIPKPDHLVDAENELLSFEGIKKFPLQFAGSQQFSCVGCEDIFPSQFVLDDHLGRQSYQLTLECPQCLKKCTFTNKCKMYEHLRSLHDMDRTYSAQVAAQYASLQVLPRSQIKLTESTSTTHTGAADFGGPDELLADDKMEAGEMMETTSTLEDGRTLESGEMTNGSADVDRVEDAKTNGQIAGTTGEKQVAMEESITENGVDGTEFDELDTSISCSECSKSFETEWTLQTHFSMPSEDGDYKPEICIPCKVELVTPCAKKAHMRVHGLTEPFVCPDCGQTMYKKNVFLKHIRLHCLHYSAISEFTCPGCSESFSTADEQLSHLKAIPAHLRFERERSYYKCNGCPKAFKSVAAHSKHESCPGAGCTVVHMCNNCPQQTVFRSWTELTDHRAQAHPELIWKPKRSKLFACYLCIHKSRTKQGLLDHLLKAHSKKKVDYMCQYCGVEVDSRQSLETHKEVCAFKDVARGSEKAPLAIAERVPKLSSGSSVISDVSVNIAQDSADPAAPAAASTTSTTTATIAQSTRRDMSYLAHTPSFNCHICTAEFLCYNKLRDHVTRRHDGRGMIYECWLCKDRGSMANYYRQAALDKHMIDAHKIQISTPPIPGSLDAPAANGEELSEDEAPTKKMKIWSNESQPYQCCRCEYLSESVGDFRDHIKQHKGQPDSYQCAECGMCFTVQLALRRHLFAVHKVQDYAKYSRSQYMAEFERQLHDTQGRCPVCKRQFDDELQLRKHLRTHGMMYINTRRLIAS